MGVRVYGSQSHHLQTAQEAEEASRRRFDETTAALDALIQQSMPKSPRRRYPADLRWNLNRKHRRRTPWLWVGKLDGPGSCGGADRSASRSAAPRSRGPSSTTAGTVGSAQVPGPYPRDTEAKRSGPRLRRVDLRRPRDERAEDADGDHACS